MTAANDNSAKPTQVASCPNCGKPAVSAFRPFCSGRCKDVDLARWLRGSYAIPGTNSDEDKDGDSAAQEIEQLRSQTRSDTDPA